MRYQRVFLFGSPTPPLTSIIPLRSTELHTTIVPSSAAGPSASGSMPWARMRDSGLKKGEGGAFTVPVAPRRRLGSGAGAGAGVPYRPKLRPIEAADVRPTAV